jgi:hypothetical protein
MNESTPATTGRKIFNVFAAVVLVFLFCAAMAVGVASIPTLLESRDRE